MEVNKKIQDIINRHEIGYTNTLYGNSFYSSLQRDTDFDELIKEVKKMNVIPCCKSDSEQLQGFFDYYKQKFGGGFNTDVLEITLKQYKETL